MSIERVPITNAVDNGIKRGIRTALDAECYGSVVILLYAGRDAVASLGRPRALAGAAIFHILPKVGLE